MDQDRNLSSAYRGTVLSNPNLHVVVNLLYRMVGIAHHLHSDANIQFTRNSQCYRTANLQPSYRMVEIAHHLHL